MKFTWLKLVYGIIRTKAIEEMEHSKSFSINFEKNIIIQSEMKREFKYQ